jgi:hypothetical protein
MSKNGKSAAKPNQKPANDKAIKKVNNIVGKKSNLGTGGKEIKKDRGF